MITQWVRLRVFFLWGSDYQTLIWTLSWPRSQLSYDCVMYYLKIRWNYKNGSEKRVFSVIYPCLPKMLILAVNRLTMNTFWILWNSYWDGNMKNVIPVSYRKWIWIFSWSLYVNTHYFGLKQVGFWEFWLYCSQGLVTNILQMSFYI